MNLESLPALFRHPAEVTLRLPYPPSVNTYWRHVGPRVLISKAGRAYRKAVQALCATTYRKPPLAGRLGLGAVLHPPDRRVRDLDNTLKALLDALKHAGVYHDDSQIDCLFLLRGSPLPGGLSVVLLWNQVDVPGASHHE